MSDNIIGAKIDSHTGYEIDRTTADSSTTLEEARAHAHAIEIDRYRRPPASRVPRYLRATACGIAAGGACGAAAWAATRYDNFCDGYAGCMGVITTVGMITGGLLGRVREASEVCVARMVEPSCSMILMSMTSLAASSMVATRSSSIEAMAIGGGIVSSLYGSLGGACAWLGFGNDRII